MPKKRHFNFKPLQGSASSSSPSNKPNVPDNSPSVNERLSELRRLEGKDAAAKKRQLAESVNQRSVPPDAQRILGVAETAPPKPRRDVNARARERLRGTPGPAAPRSWMKGGGAAWGGSLVVRGKKSGLKAKANEFERDRPKELLRFARLTGTVDDGDVDRKPPRLSHLALKTVATLWDAFDEDDYPALAEIPLRLRLRLLSYIVHHGPPIDGPALRALLQGSDCVQHLDLAGLIGHRGLTLKKIQRFLEQDQELTESKNEEVVVESWDAEDTFDSALQPTLSSRFSQLTHLSLSHPRANGASWKDLLSVSRHIPQLTHLSLAYWPRPTLTPNLSTSTVSTPDRQEISAGGSHYYSAFDSDMEEPASLIRQLSANLLCLQWLDLEGCASWLPAFSRLATGTLLEDELAHYNGVRRANSAWSEETVPSPSTPPPSASIFLSNWKNLSYVRCVEGEIPTLQGVNALLDDGSFAASSPDRKLIDRIAALLKQDLAALQSDADMPREVLEVERKRAMMWLRREQMAIKTAVMVNKVRKRGGGRMVVFDHGWMQTQSSFAAGGQ